MFFYVLAKRFADVLLKVEHFLENKKISLSRPFWPVKLPMCETKNRYTGELENCTIGDGFRIKF